MSGTIQERPKEWIKKIDETLLAMEEKPQFGLPHPTLVEQLQEKLAIALDRPSLTLSVDPKGWVEQKELEKGLSAPLFPLTIHLSPIEEPAYFLTTQQDLQHLLAEFLGGDKSASFFYESSMLHSFYTYFSAEVLAALEESQSLSPLTPRLGEIPPAIESMGGQEPLFVIDVSLKFEQCSVDGRIVLPKSFRSGWKAFFAHHPPPPLSQEAREKLGIELALEVGHSELTFAAWKEVKEGDFIFLDRCSYDPREKKGGVVLSLAGKPVFRGRFKGEKIELSSYPVFEEVREMLDEDDMLEDDLTGGEEEPLVDEVDETSEPLTAEPIQEEAPSIKPEELPLLLTVEAGRVRLTAQELMDLTPGNLIELKVDIEQGVDLVVSGKKVGRGELVRLGDTLGVRILSL